MITKDLGMVTAYAYAVSKGYTGTEEEFAELMASYASVAQEAVDAALAAAQSAQSAQSAKTAAEGARDTAQSTVAGAIAGIQAEGQTQVGVVQSEGTAQVGNVNSAGSTQVSAVQAKGEEVLNSIPADYTALSGDVDDLKSEIVTKAEVDGYYQDMTVGDAEQLVSSQYVEDSVPYKFRTSGGSADVGNREYVDKIVGGTVCWNQLNNNVGNARTSAGVTFTKNADGSWKANGTSTGYAQCPVSGEMPTSAGHKILITASSNASLALHLWGNNSNVNLKRTTEGDIYNIIDGITNMTLYLVVSSGTTVENAMCYPQLFDLTQMFGSAVADAVYAMEQATAGAGVAWFRKLFPNDYYEYNAGELISVSGLQSHDTVGFNQWDEQWEVGEINGTTGANANTGSAIRSKNYIPVLPGQTYYGKIGSSWINIYQYEKPDASGYIGVASATNATITLSDKCHYIRFATGTNYGTTYKNDICINLAWSGTRNGEYHPYEKHSYPLDSSLTLRGVPKLSADNQLYFDGDEYLPDGKVNRRYGIVDLGTLNWIYRNNESSDTFSSTPFSGYNLVSNVPAICSKYVYNGTIAGIGSMNTAPDKSFALYHQNSSTGTGLYIKDSSYTDANAFKASLSGVYLVYELATPTEETAEAYSGIQLVNDWGTEEYVSGTICPVGHETRYPANLRDKLQHLPDLASADGYYVVQQTGSQMSLVHFRIPQAPADDGTYTLKATVSGGVPTYTWEVVT